MTAATNDAAGDAAEVANASARRAGVEIVDAADPTLLRAVSAHFDRVWGRPADATPILAPEALIALAHAGGQVSAALADGRLVGATAAFVGWRDRTVSLHSHVTGVDDRVTRRGVGTALKWHQRAWCLARDIPTVRWTFDPSIRRNAVFNLLVLGAQVERWFDDLYGPMPDARNLGHPTDRIQARWDLTAPRVRAAAMGRAAGPDVHALRGSGAQPVLWVGTDGRPRTAVSHAPRRLVQVPADIEALRASDPDAARDWATLLRKTLGDRLRAGWRVTGVSRDGWYALSSADHLTDLRGGR